MPNRETPVEIVVKMIDDMNELRAFMADNPRHTHSGDVVGDVEVRIARGFLTLHAQRKV